VTRLVFIARLPSGNASVAALDIRLGFSILTGQMASYTPKDLPNEANCSSWHPLPVPTDFVNAAKLLMSMTFAAAARQAGARFFSAFGRFGLPSFFIPA
jgi:hypothetical protein